jgi:hypothetical protein
VVEKLLAGHRHGLAGADGKRNVALFRAFVFGGRQRFDIRKNFLMRACSCANVVSVSAITGNSVCVKRARRPCPRNRTQAEPVSSADTSSDGAAPQQIAWRDVVCGGVGLGFGEIADNAFNVRMKTGAEPS